MNGICFTEPMFKMIVRGLKTQTRRIVKPQPDDDGLWNDDLFPRSLDSDLVGWNGTVDATGESKQFNPRYKVGQVLFLKEPYCQDCDHIKHEHSQEWKANGKIRYKFAGDEISELAKDSYAFGKWKNKLFMPVHYARYFIKITGVRCERLQDISSEDCKKEGIEYYNGIDGLDGYAVREITKKILHENFIVHFRTPQEAYAALINKIHKRDIWSENPFVWVYDFVKCEKP